MANYNTIRGLRVKYLSADPAGAEDGQVWYNSTTGSLRVDGISLPGSWATGGSLNTKHNGASASGTQNAALVSGGNDGLAPNYSTVNSEEYNGTSWTEGNNRSVSVYNTMGSGSQTAALAFGGNGYTAGVTTATEEYDGTNWTAGGALNTGTDAGIGFGLQNASVKAGGYIAGPGVATNSSEEYNGSAWTAGNNINTARSEQPGGFGILTAGVMFGGAGAGTPGTVTTTVEEYNGTNWSTVNSTSVGHSGAWAAGTQTDGIGGGGAPTPTAAELYDGTNWSSAPSLATGRSGANGLGTPSSASAALVSAGEPSRVVTEEFTGATVVTKNISTS